MISFSCSNCNRLLKAPEEKAGASIACPGCKQTLVIPPPAPPAAPDAFQADQPQAFDNRFSSSPAPVQNQVPAWVWVLVAVLGGGTLLGCIACTGVFFSARWFGQNIAARSTRMTKSIVSNDGRFEVTTPARWREKSDLHASATLQVADEFNKSYLMVLRESKSDFARNTTLQNFSDLISRSLQSKMTNPRVVKGPTRMTINGQQAIQYEFRGIVKNIQVIYLLTNIEGKSSFYQVVGWTVPSKVATQRPVLEAIVKSFKETGQ